MTDDTTREQLDRILRGLAAERYGPAGHAWFTRKPPAPVEPRRIPGEDPPDPRPREEPACD
jgi:hypothetical protein